MSEMNLQEIGRVDHFFPKASVVVLSLTESLSVGDKIRIIGATTDFEQIVNSMEIEHKKIKIAEAGSSIGLKVEKRARENDLVFKVVS
jgi:putative protease